MIKHKRQNYIIVCLGLLSMMFLVYIGTTLGKRLKIDFTEEKLYTLSSGTLSILKKLDSPLTMKLYYSKTAANKGSEGIRIFNNYFRYVRDMLDEYVANSQNNLTLEVIDPRPDTSDEEDAMAYGLKRFPLSETEKYFFGLVVKNEAGSEKVIEFFDPNKQEKLEYEVTKLIYTVTNPKKKRVGIVSSLPVMVEQTNPYMAQLMRMQGKSLPSSWLSTEVLSDFFDIKKIELTAKKIEGIDVLIIIHPKHFEDPLLFAIDQFVLNGGKVLLFVDPHSVVDPTRAPRPGMEPDTKSNLTKLMKNWGVELVDGKFAGDKYLAGMARVSPMSPVTRVLPIVKCDRRCGEGYKDIISTQLNDLIFVFPGVLKTVSSKKENVITPILATTDKGNSYTAYGYEKTNPAFIWNKFKEGNERVVIGYRIVGKFNSAFPEGITVPVEEKGDKKAKQKKSKKSLNKKITGLIKSKIKTAIIVFSDVDFISDQFAFNRTILGAAAANDNINLFINSIESLTGPSELLSLRSRGRFNRSFDVVDKIEFEAEAKTASKVKQINANIAHFTKELRNLGSKATNQNISLLQNEGINKKKELAKKIAVLRKELRMVKREGREKIENLGKFLQYINTLLIPLLLLIIGLIQYYRRNYRYKISIGGSNND